MTLTDTISSSGEIGVLVRGEFVDPMELARFMRAGSPSRQAQDRVDVGFKKRRPGQTSPESVPFYSTRFFPTDPAMPRVHLLGFPRAIPRDFLVTDLRLPTSVAGFVLIVDLHLVFSVVAYAQSQAQRNQAPIQFDRAVSEGGELAWIRKHELPFVVTTTNPRPPAIPLEELFDLIGLQSDDTVLSCSTEFEREEVERVLSALVKQIEQAH